MYIGARQGQRDTREAGAAADVGDALIGSQELSESRAVENVSIPEPVHFPRTDQTPLDTGTGKNRRVPFGGLQTLSEDLRRGVRCRGDRSMFHVKHPPHSLRHRRRKTNYTLVTKTQPSRTTTRRDGSTPSLSLRTPSTAATAS